MIRAPRRSARAAGVAAVLGVASLFAPPATAQQSSVDQLLPSDTLFVVSVDDHESYSKALDTMPLGKILAEPDVQAFLEKPKTMLAEAVEKFQAHIRTQEGFENFELSLQELTQGTYGRMFLAVTHIGMPDPQAGQMFPDIGLVLGVEGKKGAPDWQGLVKDVLGRAAGNAGVEVGFQPVEAEGYTYEQLSGAPGGGPPVLLARQGNLQLFSLSHQSLRGVLDRASGKQTEGGLAANATYRDTQKHVAIDDAGAMRLYMNTNLGIRTLAEGIKFAMTMESETEMLPLVDTILDKTGLLGLKGIAVGSHSANGIAISRSFVAMAEERKGLLALPSNEPIDLGLLDVVPKGTTSLSIAQIDIAGLYDFVMDLVKTVDENAHAQANAMIQGFGAQIGGETPLDLRNDILANIGPQFAFLAPETSNPMMPSYLFLFQTKDGAKVVSSLQKLLDFGSQMSGGEFTTKVSSYKEHDIVQVNAGAEMGMPLNPAFSVVDGYLTIALNVGDLKRHIRNAASPGESIRESEDFKRFFSKVPTDAHLSSLTYTDVKKSVEDGYSSIVMALPMVTMAADFELPFEMALLPTQDKITQHLFGSLGYTRIDENGAFTQTYGPIGGEAIGVVAGGAVAGLALFGVTRMEAAHSEAAVPPPIERLEESPKDQVGYDLSNLKAAATIYKLQKGTVPASLDQLLEPFPDYPQGAIGRDTLPVDPWGNAYRYEVRGSGYALWSIGPNGLDDGGAEDDILVEKK